MSKDVLYCGDATLESGACYLAGIMTRAGIGYDYVPFDVELPSGQLDHDYRLYLLSDYPSGMLPEQAMKTLIERVEAGASLLMIGGWESFHGLIGHYHRTPLAKVLPVDCLDHDDRNNWYQGLMPEVTTSHPSIAGLPWDQPPVVCGYNEVKAKPGSTVVLSLRKVLINNGAVSLDEHRLPLLVIGSYGKGRTGAFSTDIAPHWVGGMVDWGKGRVKAQAPGARAIEVGDAYAGFIEKLIRFFL